MTGATRAKCCRYLTVPLLVTAAEVINTCLGMSWSTSLPSMRYFRHTNVSDDEPFFGGSSFLIAENETLVALYCEIRLFADCAVPFSPIPHQNSFL